MDLVACSIGTAIALHRLSTTPARLGRVALVAPAIDWSGCRCKTLAADEAIKDSVADFLAGSSP